MGLDWVTDTRYGAMKILEQAGHGLTLGNISEDHWCGKSTVSKSLERLSDEGLLRQDENRVYHLTNRGKGVLQYLDEIVIMTGDPFEEPEMDNNNGDKG